MALLLDDEFIPVHEALVDAAAGITPPAVGDVYTRREAVEGLQRVQHGAMPTPTDVQWKDYEIAAKDGTPLLARWYTKTGSEPTGSAVLFIHGGGMILGNVEIYNVPVARHVSATGVPFLSVEYRYAPEFKHPVPVEDCHAALVWLHNHAEELGVDVTRIGIMGDSGGGGIAGGLALYTRDHRGPDIAGQILVYPMLDDRTVDEDPLIAPFVTWTWADNITGWSALLGDSFGGDEVDPHAAPARATDLSGLPPAYLEVGELDIFRDETIAYAKRLANAGVTTELHVHPGVPHAWEIFAPTIDVSLRAFADRNRAIARL